MNSVDTTKATPPVILQPDDLLNFHQLPDNWANPDHETQRPVLSSPPKPYSHDSNIDFLKIKSVDDYFPQNETISANECLKALQTDPNLESEISFSRKDPNRLSLRTQQLLADAQVRLLNQYNCLKDQRLKSNQAKKDKEQLKKQEALVKVWISDDVNHHRPETSFSPRHSNSHPNKMSFSQSQTDILKDGTTLYEDRFCRLSHTHILLKTYYFPFFNAISIAIPDIEALFYDDQLFDCVHTRGWGCSFTGTWWGCDMGRDCGGNSESVNVVLDVKNQATYKGFTVRDFEAFFTALRAVIDRDIPVIHGIP